MTRPARTPLAVHACALAMLGGCLFTTFHHRRWGLDDAYITYRYALNLVRGHGLVFNPGEAVEGYTNFLYALLVAPGIAALGPEAAYAWSVALNTLLSVAAVYAVHAAVAPRLGTRAWIPCALLATSPAVWVACWSGLETPLVVALFAVAWAAYARLPVGPGDASRAPVALAAALAALVLARADGFVMASIFVAYAAAAQRRVGRLGPAALCAGAAAFVFALHVAFRLATYGAPLPNSYYAKVAGSVVDRLAFAAETLPGLAAVAPYVGIAVVCAAAAGVDALRGRTSGAPGPARRLPPFEIGFPIAWVAYWLYVGGDVFGDRFLLVLIPLGGYLLAARGARLVTGAASRAAAVAVLVALVALPWLDVRIVAQRTTEDRFVELGRALGARYGGVPGTVLASDTAGKVPFYSGLETIDMYGLNDATIGRKASAFTLPGHSKSDPTYVLSRRPALIAGWLDPGTFAVNPGVRRDAYVRAGYRLHLLVYTPKGGHPKDRGPALLVAADGLTPRQVRDYYARGYRYAILAREDGARLPPREGAARSAGDDAARRTPR